MDDSVTSSVAAPVTGSVASTTTPARGSVALREGADLCWLSETAINHMKVAGLVRVRVQSRLDRRRHRLHRRRRLRVLPVRPRRYLLRLRHALLHLRLRDGLARRDLRH